MYSDLIVTHFTEPTFVGDLDSYDIEYEIGNSVCGDRIRIQVALFEGAIINIAFRAWGCATSVATADIFCNSVKGATLEAIASRDDSAIEMMLGELEPSQRHCINILSELHQKLVEEVTVGE